MHEMGHHSFQGPLPLAGGTRTGAGIGTVFTDVFMLWFLCMVESQGTACGSILQRQKETYCIMAPSQNLLGANIFAYLPTQVSWAQILSLAQLLLFKESQVFKTSPSFYSLSIASCMKSGHCFLDTPIPTTVKDET